MDKTEEKLFILKENSLLHSKQIKELQDHIKELEKIIEEFLNAKKTYPCH